MMPSTMTSTAAPKRHVKDSVTAREEKNPSASNIIRFRRRIDFRVFCKHAANSAGMLLHLESFRNSRPCFVRNRHWTDPEEQFQMR